MREKHTLGSSWTFSSSGGGGLNPGPPKGNPEIDKTKLAWAFKTDNAEISNNMLVMIDSKNSWGPGDLLVGERYLEVWGKALDSRRAWRRSWSGQGRGSWREEERDGGSGGSPASGAEVEEGRPSHRWWGTFGIVVSQAVGHIPQPHNPHLSLPHHWPHQAVPHSV